ncbi:MAG TPA: hypothetical protein VHC63_02490 [Acidimicrobiales bacterium]|nr:hypothetical protein [Acidimicrobiales bacterium]
MAVPLSPAPVTQPDGDLLPAYLSNGVVGLRVRDVPLRAGFATLSGLEGEHPETGIACVPAIPYPLAGDIQVDDFRLSHHGGRVEIVDQRYDFSCGELTSRLRVRAGDAEVRVEVLTFCSRTQPSVVAQETTVSVDRDARVALTATIDPSGVPGSWYYRSTSVPGAGDDSVDGVMLWSTLGELATCGLAMSTECSNPFAQQTRDESRNRPLRTTYATDLSAGEPLTVRHLTAVVPSANHAQPHRQAVRLVATAHRRGFEQLRSDNRAAWADLWLARPFLSGAERRWQEMVDAAFFYVHTSTHPGSLSTHPFGLAQWYGYHYYYGHVMWDVDTFIVAPLTLTSPPAARALLDFRSRCLEAARENARLGGYTGVQFPWEASPSRGEEAAPALGTASAYEHHVSADVAHAFAQLAHARGDDVFLRDKAWPVLAGCADWLVSRAVRTSRGWEIREAMGIAERKEPADNSAFVNMSATVALDDALWCAERLGVDAPAAWRSMRDGLVLPVRDNVVVDHDGYDPDEEKGATPAALAGVFPLGYTLHPEVEAATLRFYLDMADEYVGSPMLSALLGAWAARAGDRAEATRLFDEGYAKFCSSRFNVMHEYRHDRFPEQPVSGPFLANAAGFLMALLYGLPGIAVGPGEPASWCARPVAMPDAWDGIEVERLWVRDAPMSLHACHGDARARLTPA